MRSKSKPKLPTPEELVEALTIVESMMLDTEDAARYLGVSANLLTVWRLRGDGPRYLQLAGGRIKYQKHALDAYVTSHEIVPHNSQGLYREPKPAGRKPKPREDDMRAAS